MCFSVMILKASLKVILQALKQKKKDLPEEVERWLGEDKIILYYNIKKCCQHLLSNKCLNPSE